VKLLEGHKLVEEATAATDTTEAVDDTEVTRVDVTLLFGDETAAPILMAEM
jgi:hypothetical protein